MSRRILVADDSSTIQKVIKIAFGRFPVEMVEASSYTQALAACQKTPVDCLIIDASLPGARGAQDFSKLARDESHASGILPTLLLVGTYEAVDEAGLKAAGFKHFLKKPFESADIVNLVDQMLGGSLLAAAFRAPGESIPAGHSSRPNHAAVIGTPPGSLPSGPAATLKTSTVPPPPGGIIGGMPPIPKTFVADNPAPPAPPAASGRPPVPEMRPPIPFAEEPPTFALAHDQDTDPGYSMPAFTESPALIQSSVSTQPTPPVEEGRKGRRAFAGGRAPIAGEPGEVPKMQAAPLTPALNNKSSIDISALSDSLDKALPPLVRAAVEAYCEKHFKSLAREIIAGELRRLADEKAAHLVDD